MKGVRNARHVVGTPLSKYSKKAKAMASVEAPREVAKAMSSVEAPRGVAEAIKHTVLPLLRMLRLQRLQLELMLELGTSSPMLRQIAHRPSHIFPMFIYFKLTMHAASPQLPHI